MTEQEIAERCAELFWEGDRLAKHLGFRFVSAGPGRAVVASTVTEIHLNIHNTAHGGGLFALAGTAFGIACNSRNHLAVAEVTSMNYVGRAVTGDVLTATAKEVSRAGKTAVFDIRIENSEGTPIALARGVARNISGTVIPE